jgi:disulfide oxidoreductase YuzD
MSNQKIKRKPLEFAKREREKHREKLKRKYRKQSEREKYCDLKESPTKET